MTDQEPVRRRRRRKLTIEEMQIATQTIAEMIVHSGIDLDYSGLADIGQYLVESEAKFSFKPEGMLDRAKTPGGDGRAINHPIYGVCYDEGAGLQTFYDVEYLGGSGKDTLHIGQGQAHERRLEAGRWLQKHWPDEDQKMFHQMYLDAIYPIDWEDEENPDTIATIGRIELAMAVIEAGGACTICSVEPYAKGEVMHAIGCECVSAGMWAAWHERYDEDGEPTLGQIVAAAEAQIARMQ